MNDGTTPLILAARLAIEGMVEDLINADADINAADDLGKTPLHWAASVNNVEAVQILLAHGANRDAQDNRVSFLKLFAYLLYQLFFKLRLLFFYLCSSVRNHCICFIYVRLM